MWQVHKQRLGCSLFSCHSCFCPGASQRASQKVNFGRIHFTNIKGENLVTGRGLNNIISDNIILSFF